MRRKSRCVTRHSGTSPRPIHPADYQTRLPVCRIQAVSSGMCPSQLRQLKKKYTGPLRAQLDGQSVPALLMLYLDPNLRQEFISPGEIISSSPGRILVFPSASPRPGMSFRYPSCDAPRRLVLSGPSPY